MPAGRAAVFGCRYALLSQSSLVPVDLWAVHRLDGSLVRLVGRSTTVRLQRWQADSWAWSGPTGVCPCGQHVAPQVGRPVALGLPRAPVAEAAFDGRTQGWGETAAARLAPDQLVNIFATLAARLHARTPAERRPPTPGVQPPLN